VIALPSLENGRYFFPLLARGPSWRLIHDEQFRARRKFKKRELEKAAKDFETFVVSNVGKLFFSSANEGPRLNQKIKIKFGTREGVSFLSVYSVSPEAVGRWPGGYKATV
jgi:hypothetical protein